jgi:hypothetical protein
MTAATTRVQPGPARGASDGDTATVPRQTDQSRPSPAERIAHKWSADMGLLIGELRGLRRERRRRYGH